MAKVLVIDDTEEHLNMLRMVLQMKNHKVQIALDRETALPMLVGFKPDLILLDVFLGNGKSGRECCKEIKASHPYVFIILISADQKSLEHYQDCGADGIIEKPFDIYTVFETINDLVKS